MLQDNRNLSATVARLRQLSPTAADDAGTQIDQAARQLQALPGDFLFLGASPIRIGLQLMRLAPDRGCHFVPFSGGWLRFLYFDEKGVQAFSRSPSAPNLPFESYRDRLLPNLTKAGLLERQTPLNIVDCTHTGKGQISFCDLLVDLADNANSARKIAANLNLVSIVRATAASPQIRHCRWRTHARGLITVDCQPIEIADQTWELLVSGSGRNYGCDDPRLTVPYPATDWHSPPQLAPASNLAAFRRAAQGISPERLRAAGLHLSG